jgi:hypothetical protein
MAMNRVKKRKKLIICSLVSMIIMCALILCISSDALKALAEENQTSLLSEDEIIRTLATDVAKDLADTTKFSNGATLSSGVYYLSQSRTFTATGTGGNGLKIQNNAVVYIYIPNGITLTANGGNGSYETAGGAGILLPSNATLVLLGEGSVDANGGNAGSGRDGGSGSAGSINTSSETFTMATGGSGGNGGGGGFNMASMMASMAVGGAVGQNIAGAMNNMMGGINQQTTPGTVPPIPTVAYHVAVNGQAAGPFGISVLTQMATAGQFTADSLVWKNGMPQWAKAGTVDELKNLFAGSMPPIPPIG